MSEIEKATLDALVAGMAPRLKLLIDGLIVAGYSTEDIGSVLIPMTRKMAQKRDTFTELSVLEYLSRVERGEAQPPAVMNAKPDTKGGKG